MEMIIFQNMHQKLFWFGMVTLFNGMLTFVGYLMLKPLFEMNNSSII